MASQLLCNVSMRQLDSILSPRCWRTTSRHPSFQVNRFCFHSFNQLIVGLTVYMVDCSKPMESGETLLTRFKLTKLIGALNSDLPQLLFFANAMVQPTTQHNTHSTHTTFHLRPLILLFSLSSPATSSSCPTLASLHNTPTLTPSQPTATCDSHLHIPHHP